MDTYSTSPTVITSRPRRTRALGLVALTLVAAIGAVAGCSSHDAGHHSGDRPTVAEVKRSLLNGKAGDLTGLSGADLPEATTDCIAKAVVGSGLTDKAIRALTDGDAGYQPSEQDTLALTELETKMQGCVAAQ